MFASAFDNLVSFISPRWAARRMAWRAYGDRVRAARSDHEMMRKLMSNRNGGYEAGKNNRLTTRLEGSNHENDLPRGQIINMRWRSWNLYRNNPQARKIVRNLNAKVVGRGFSPQPQATTTDGQAFVEFRRRARRIWDEFSVEADFRGRPGRGGQHLVTMHKSALKQAILGGSVLVRFRRLSESEQKANGLLLPLQLQLLHGDRIDETKHGGNTWYGVELDDDGRTVAYWVTRGGVLNQVSRESIRVPASDLIHLFVEEDIDQILGTPWLGAALLTMDDRRNYEYSELTAAEMGACFVAGYRRSRGQKQLGLPNPDANCDLTDGDGNRIDRLQPGMFIDLGVDGELQMINPQRPNSGSEGFIGHLIRSEAVAVPGIKSSTLTGDYRNSSFSSERSADNDVWPEIEDLQDWFSTSFTQPIYEQVIETAVLIGLFDDVEGFSAEDFVARRRDYLKTKWQGPVARSINPLDDAQSARERVRAGVSSPQRECAQIGRDWREVLQEVSEFRSYCEEIGLPPDVWQQALGIDQSDSGSSGGSSGSEQQDNLQRDSEDQQDQEMASRRLLNSVPLWNRADA